MKRFYLFIITTFILTLICGSAAKAQQLISLVYSGEKYTAAQTSASDGGYPYAVESYGDYFYIYDESSGINAEISCQSLDDEAFELLRDYYNDTTLSKSELFNRFIELNKSYIPALESLYNTNYLSVDKNVPETAMRVFYEGSDRLFGLPGCSVYLYNIARYEGLQNKEQTHLDLIIPVRTTNSVILIKFIIPHSELPNKASDVISDILSGIKFEGLSTQSGVPSVLRDNHVLEAARLGIYPAASQESPVYRLFDDSETGFSLSLPDTYVPFVQNNLGGVFSYTSFKIDPNQIFSISSEPLLDSDEAAAISRFKVASLTSINITETGEANFGHNNYSYIIYNSTEDNIKQYFYDYYIQDESRLYKLQLHCSISGPGTIVLEQFEKILESFSVNKKETANSQATNNNQVALLKAFPSEQAGITAFEEYLNSEEGYCFKYPVGWRLEDTSQDIECDRFRLIVPGLSGALEISIQESELKQYVGFIDVMKSVNGESISSWPSITKNYDPPFAGKTSKLLYSDFKIDGNISTIYRLGAFMDDYGRNRLCYSVDILRDRKLYSMFITAGEYKTSEGRFNEPEINELINAVAASFRLENTPEALYRKSIGETRNRKVVFVEKYLKGLIDPKLVITSIEKTQPDKTFYVTVDKTGESGFYKIKLDYANKKVEVLEQVLRRNILNQELTSLKKKYSGKILANTFQNESNMTITIESRENRDSELTTRTYRVNTSLADNKVVWHTERLAHREDYLWECEQYLKSVLPPGSDVYLYGNNAFADLEVYRKSNMGYRVLTYSHSKNLSGFLLISMDPVTTLFTTAGTYLPIEKAVDEIKRMYGIEHLYSSPDAISFDPETFVLSLKTADNKGNYVSTEQFKVYYHFDKEIMVYERIAAALN